MIVYGKMKNRARIGFIISCLLLAFLVIIFVNEFERRYQPERAQMREPMVVISHLNPVASDTELDPNRNRESEVVDQYPWQGYPSGAPLKPPHATTYSQQPRERERKGQLWYGNCS